MPQLVTEAEITQNLHDRTNKQGEWGKTHCQRKTAIPKRRGLGEKQDEGEEEATRWMSGTWAGGHSKGGGAGHSYRHLQSLGRVRLLLRGTPNPECDTNKGPMGSE